VVKEKWKCPSLCCTQECGRRANMIRHIKRIHGGLGSPVKDKPSAIDHSVQNMLVNSDTLSSHSRKRPLNSQANENDIIDIMYEKVIKVKEIKAFFSGQPGSTIFPLPGPLPVSPIDPAVGLHTYVCANCLTAPIDPVKLSDFTREGPLAFRPIHVCKQEDLETKRRRAENGVSIDVIRVWNQLHSSAIEFIANTVHQWYGPHNDVSIHVAEADDSRFVSEKLLPINLGTIANDHWVYRALGGNKRKGTAPINERELMEFVKLASGTFGLFHVKVRNEERDLYAYLGPELM
jgi:hypothetical protein